MVEWKTGELFPKVGFIVTIPRFGFRKRFKPAVAGQTWKIRSKRPRYTLSWDKTSCHRFEANQARLRMGALAYNLFHMVREFHLKGEDVKRPME